MSISNFDLLQNHMFGVQELRPCLREYANYPEAVSRLAAALDCNPKTLKKSMLELYALSHACEGLFYKSEKIDRKSRVGKDYHFTSEGCMNAFEVLHRLEACAHEEEKLLTIADALDYDPLVLLDHIEDFRMLFWITSGIILNYSTNDN